MALCALASVVTWAAVFLLPVFVQSVQGRSALAAGLALAPQGLITGLSTALAPRWLARLTVRATVLAGFAVLAVASTGLLLIAASTPLWLIALILTARSVSVGLVINPLLQALIQPLQVLMHPQQVRVVRGGDDADHGRALLEAVRVAVLRQYGHPAVLGGPCFGGPCFGGPCRSAVQAGEGRDRDRQQHLARDRPS